MKKAFLIISILISVSLVWYFYTIEEVKSKAIAHEGIEDYQRALEYYKEYAELTNDNTEYLKKLYEIANKQLDYKDYINAESNFNKYKNINLSGGWVFNSVDSTQVNQHKLSTNRLAEEYIEIYENTGRLEEALDLYLTRTQELMIGFCGLETIENQRNYYNKSFDLSYQMNKLDTALYIYLDNIYFMATIYDIEAIEDVINHNISEFNNHQKDSILNAVFDSYELSVSRDKDYYSYQTNFEIFGKRIPAIITPRPLNKLDSNISITDTTYMINQDWERFKNTRLYQLLAERK